MVAPIQITLRATEFPSTGSARAARAGGSLQIWTTGHHVIQWIERHCVLTAADYIGRPFELLPWQKRLLLELFEMVPDDRQPSGWRRKHRWALIGVPKKNGKTELCAALALYFLIADDEGAPFIPVAAASDQQANLIFGACKIMCEMSPTLQAVTTLFEKEIQVLDKPGASIRRIAAATGTNDGPNVFVAFIDEFHEWTGTKGRNVWNILTNGTGARKQPLIVQVTTAGSDDESVEYEQYEYCCKVRDGSVEDEAYYFYWIEAAPEDDYTDPAVWERVNPSFGLIQQEEFYADQCTKKTEAVFRRYFLNQHTEAEEIWEAASLWDGLVGNVEMDASLPIYVGIDIGLRNDSSAVVWFQKVGDSILQSQVIWENPYSREDPRHGEWKYDPILAENLCRELAEQYQSPAEEDDEEGPLWGPAFYYDPHFFSRSAIALESDGLNMVEFPQTDSRMVPASQRYFEIIKSGELVHDDDPVMRRHIRTVIAKPKERGWRISKPTGSRKHIDGAVAGAMGAYGCTEAHDVDEEAPAVW